MSYEKSPYIEPSEVPYLGAMPHLEWLANLSVPESMDAREFLEATGAVTSLARFIHRNRVRWPSQYQNKFIFDTRQMKIADWPGHFYASIDVFNEEAHDPSGATPNYQLLGIFGQPYPRDSQGFEYEYHLSLPIKGTTYKFDPERNITALVTRRTNLDIREYDCVEYNESTARDSGRTDPQVLIWTIQHAARDITRILHHINGTDKVMPKLEPSPPELVHLYAADDQDDRNEYVAERLSALLRNAA